MKTETKKFKVISVSEYTDDFGFWRMMLVARDGESWFVTASEEQVCATGEMLHIPLWQGGATNLSEYRAIESMPTVGSAHLSEIFPDIDPDALTKRQQAIVNLLWDTLRKSPEYSDRCDLPPTTGTKTKLGLARTIERIFEVFP